MVDERFDVRHLELRELMPWVHLFRGFRVALDFKKLALGALGAFATALGWWVITFLFGAELSEPVAANAPATDDTNRAAQVEVVDRAMTADQLIMLEARRFPWEPEVGTVRDVFRSPLQEGGWSTNALPDSAYLVIYPIRRLIFPARLMFQDIGTTLMGVLMALWALCVWAIFGGAITRIAAVQIARDGHVGLSESLRFATSRFFSYLAAPLFPLLGVVVIVLIGAIAGFLSWIPGVNVVLGLLWFLPLLAGWIISIVLLGLAVGWPLMYAVISAEATEGFDAISRVYSYLLGRAWNFLFYSVVAILFGGILTTLATTFAYMTVHFSQYIVLWGGNADSVHNFYSAVPVAGGWREAFGPTAETAAPGATDWVTSLSVGFWTHLLFMGIVGFAYSYFWSSSTIIYFLLRRDVDETEMEEVFLDEEEEEPFPTVAPTLGPPPESSMKGKAPGEGDGPALTILN